MWVARSGSGYFAVGAVGSNEMLNSIEFGIMNVYVQT